MKQWKSEVKKRYSGEDFEEKWRNAFNTIRRYYGDVKGFSRSRATAEYLLGWKSIPLELEDDAISKTFSGTRKERFIDETLRRLEPLYQKYAEYESGRELLDAVEQFKSGEISYEDFKKYIEDFKKTNKDYLNNKAGSD